MSQPLLDIHQLSLQYQVRNRSVSALSNVSLSVMPGDRLGIVGESGCGKSTLALAIMGLFAANARIQGEILFEGSDLLRQAPAELHRKRGNSIGMVFQDPLSALDPSYSVGSQVADTIQIHQRVSKARARALAIILLREVGIPSPEQRFADLPARFSGGMRQRVVIAAALANNPALLIADEPTSGLDTTVQAQILAKLNDLASKHHTATILISHDLGVVAQFCDRVAVMYAGQLVELASVSGIFSEPLHPYTQALLAALPNPGTKRGELRVIAGEVPDLAAPPIGCRFAPRCPARMTVCEETPRLIELHHDRKVACWLHDSEAGHDSASPARS